MSELVGLVEKIAGPKAFEDGVVLYLDKTVDALRIDGKDVFALVRNDDDYRVKLTRTATSIEGACSCPSSEEFDFCEHCVAVALTLNQHEIELKKLQAGDPEERVQALIKQMNEAEAKDTLIRLINEDKDLLAKWEIIADAKSGQLKAAAIKKRITKALPLKSISQAAKVQEYFDNAKIKLQVIFDVVSYLEVTQAFSCVEYLVFRYDTILSRVDDSSGARHELFKKIEPLFTQCFKALPWSDSEKIDYLMNLYASDYSHFEFTDLPKRFINEHDQKLLGQFNQRLESHIKVNGIKYRKATGKIEPTSRDIIWSISYFYEQAADHDTAIEWLEKAADSIEGYTRLLEFMLKHEYKEKALSIIDVAQQHAKSAYEKRVVMMLAKRIEALD